MVNNTGSAMLQLQAGQLHIHIYGAIVLLTQHINNLSSNSISVTVTDNNGCKANTTITITQPALH